MAVKINFDGNHSVIQPTLVLVTRSGKRIGAIPAHDLVFNNSLNDGSQISFNLDMADCTASTDIWKKTTDFKLVWVMEWDRYFEISVSVDEGNGLVKHVSGESLGEAELSQINLYGVEINTEDDIAMDDYEPSVFYNQYDTRHSILHRMLAGAPHYHIGHVDNSLTTIQRSFSFHETNIRDAMQEVSEEIHCLFVFDCHTDSNSKIVRAVNAYDLESYCPECGKRGEFTGTCPYCGSDNIISGYGEDTSIFVSTDNLAESIQDTTDSGSVKNCFRLEAGDDLMTATIASCDPSGTGYIWNISDATKEDMSHELVEKLNEYETLYNVYQERYEAVIPQGVLSIYNELVRKYSTEDTPFKSITSPIVGYPNIMNAYFDTIDLYLYLNNSMMPTANMQNTTAEDQARTLARLFSTTQIAVKNIETASKSSVDSAALALAKVFIDPRYQIKITKSEYIDTVWRGKFKIQNYSDEEDTAESAQITRAVTSDYETYIRQAIKKAASKYATTDNPTDISGLFDLSDEDFGYELGKYSLVRLRAFHDACQACIDLLIQNGIADDNGTAEKENGLYSSIYLPYYTKLGLIESEIIERENEVTAIIGKTDQFGEAEITGIQTVLDNERKQIRTSLNLENFMGHELMIELSSFRRDDVYKNDNYISDGLDNAQLFKLAMQFMETAKKDISRASIIQHSFSSTLSNLLAIPEFEVLTEYFDVGNWIRQRSNNDVYRLRLIRYQINFEDFDKITVDFSDASLSSSGYSDIESIISSASSMATSFNTVARQAKKGSDSNSVLAGWVRNGLSVTQTKIVNNADSQDISWDSHGILCREYDPEFDRYDERQTKIINRGIYITDDNWRTSRVGVGDFIYYNPKTGRFEESYGVIADLLVGSMVLSEEVGIYNPSGSITMDGNGLTITADTTDSDKPIPEFTIQQRFMENDEEVISKQVYLDTDGKLVINGDVRISTGSTSFDLSNFNNRMVNLENSAEGFSISIGNTNDNFDQFTRTFYEHFDFTQNGLIISQDNEDAYVKIDNDEFDIFVANENVMKLDRTGLSADVVNVTTIHIGNYVIAVGQNGHLTIS